MNLVLIKCIKEANVSKVTTPTAIGRLIKESREISNPTVSQSKLSSELGYRNGQFISNVERGICSIPLDKIGKVAEVLSVDVDVIKDALVEDYKSKIDDAVSTPYIGDMRNEQATDSISV